MIKYARTFNHIFSNSNVKLVKTQRERLERKSKGTFQSVVVEGNLY